MLWSLLVDVKIWLMFPLPFSLRCVVRPVGCRTPTVCGPTSEYGRSALESGRPVPDSLFAVLVRFVV